MTNPATLTNRIAEALKQSLGANISLAQHEKAAAAIAAVAHPRIETTEQLDALPVGSIIRTDGGRVAVKSGEHWGNVTGRGSWWDEAGEETSCGSDELDDLPATLLWTPGDTE